MNSHFSNDKYFDITSGTSGTILDDTSSASPNIIFKTENQLGIEPINSDISFNITGLQTYQKYYDTLFSNVDNSILNDPNQNKNRRYFKPTGTKCLDEKTQKIVDQYYIIDGMAKIPGTDSKGLAFSAQALLDYVDSGNISKYYTNDEDNKNILVSSKLYSGDVLCKKARIETDPYGGSDTNYISEDNFQQWSERGVVSEAFHGNNDSMGSTHICQNTGGLSSRIKVHGWQPNWIDIGSNSGYGHFNTGFIDYNIIEKKEIEDPVIIEKINPETYGILSEARVREDKVRTQVVDWRRNEVPESMEQSSRVKYKRNRHDIFTSMFIGSCTVVGLYVVFRMLNTK